MDKNIFTQKPRLLDQVRERLRYKHYIPAKPIVDIV
jgi:hypothetical protein